MLYTPYAINPVPEKQRKVSKNVFSNVDFIAAQQNAVGNKCTTNITTLKSRSDPGQALTEIPLPETSANVQPEHVPLTSGINRSILGIVSPYSVSPVAEKRKKVSNRRRKATVAA
ncbi:unnamed protein product [Diabrotica balteata]|uniref:Uncharacterized protein n=1 Tax=Diabrotica balteata TaxID=107213 RepID=A0A9N9XEY0_DIABA|nr:unnamed protein product [Diabrotica balteata]